MKSEKQKENRTMEEKKIRRNLYRVLRKTGVQKNDITTNADFRSDFRFDNVDWKIFTFYLEGVFDISIQDDDLSRLKNVEGTIQYLGQSA